MVRFASMEHPQELYNCDSAPRVTIFSIMSHIGVEACSMLSNNPRLTTRFDNVATLVRRPGVARLARMEAATVLRAGNPHD